jgi:hypothetical protein
MILNTLASELNMSKTPEVSSPQPAFSAVTDDPVHDPKHPDHYGSEGSAASPDHAGRISCSSKGSHVGWDDLLSASEHGITLE